MNIRAAIRKYIGFILLLLAIFCVSACQPTPEREAVLNKESIKLEESIMQTAGSQNEKEYTSDDTVEKTVQSSGASACMSELETWTYKKQYGFGNTLNVDALLYNKRDGGLPVLSVKPKAFESGKQIEKIVRAFFPDEKVLEQGDQLTKSHLEQEIIKVKEQIFRVENDLPPHSGTDESIPKENKEGYLQGLMSAIEYYEKMLKTAPDESDLNEASYQLVDVGSGSSQSNMLVKAEDATINVSFSNWKKYQLGSILYIQSPHFDYELVGTHSEYVVPEALATDSDFASVKNQIDQCVRDMGIDYMSLNMVNTGKDSYGFYYTRVYNGLQETYVNRHIGTTATGIDGAEMMILWNPEYLYIVVQNHDIVKVTWENPSEVSEVVNENVQTLSWDEIQEIFKTQMDYLLLPENNKINQDGTGALRELQININRIELGLTKVLMKDSQDDYKLIPTWSFMGYDQNTQSKSENIGAETCYLTINAIDGTIIDRGLMY